VLLSFEGVAELNKPTSGKNLAPILLSTYHPSRLNSDETGQFSRVLRSAHNVDIFLIMMFFYLLNFSSIPLFLFLGRSILLFFLFRFPLDLRGPNSQIYDEHTSTFMLAFLRPGPKTDRCVHMPKSSVATETRSKPRRARRRVPHLCLAPATYKFAAAAASSATHASAKFPNRGTASTVAYLRTSSGTLAPASLPDLPSSSREIELRLLRSLASSTGVLRSSSSPLRRRRPRDSCALQLRFDDPDSPASTLRDHRSPRRRSNSICNALSL
jgi:hypothetical protein